MKNSSLTLFESTTACFRLSINTMYEKLKDDGTTQSSVYVNPVKNTGTFRPSVFLVFTYLTTDFQTTKGIWTTVPHMYKIRQMFQTMHDIAHSEVAYTSINNETTIVPEYAVPVVVDGISRNQDWISLTLTMASDEGSIVRKPCVAVQHSKSNSFSSLLTLDEFDTIYDIIMHIDFVTLENQAVIMELVSRLEHNSAAPASYNTVPHYNSAPQTGYQTRSPYGRHVSNAAPVAPQPVTPTYAAPAPAAVPAPQVQVTKPAAPVAPMPPRAAEKPVVKKPMMTPDIIESIEVDEDMVDDSSLVDEIFSD